MTVDSQFDTEMLRRSMESLRLARISNEIEGVQEHPGDRPLAEAFARGEIDGDTMLDRVAANIEQRRRRAG